MKKYTVVALILLTCLLFACSIEGGNENVEGAKMVAIIKNIDDKIEVEVIEGDYGAFGVYWVLVNSDTVYLNENGNRVFKSAIKVGDTVETISESTSLSSTSLSLDASTVNSLGRSAGLAFTSISSRACVIAK